MDSVVVGLRPAAGVILWVVLDGLVVGVLELEAAGHVSVADRETARVVILVVGDTSTVGPAGGAGKPLVPLAHN